MKFNGRVFEFDPPWVSRSRLREPNPRTDDDTNNLFSEYIKGKRVAIVGPASSLDGLGLGDKIDSYDVVVRVNQREPVHKILHEDFGSKTDVAAYNFNITCIRILSKAETKAWLEGTDWTVVTDIRGIQSHVSAFNASFSKYAFCLNPKSSEQAGFHMLGKEYIKTVEQNIGTIPNAGLLYIVWLLQYDIKELFIAGMSFYNMGEWGDCYNVKQHSNPYYGMYRLDNVESAGYVSPGPGARKARNDIHDQQSQITYFAKLLEIYYNNPITLDPYLTKAFEVEKSNEE